MLSHIYILVDSTDLCDLFLSNFGHLSAFYDSAFFFEVSRDAFLGLLFPHQYLLLTMARRIRLLFLVRDVFITKTVFFFLEFKLISSVASLSATFTATRGRQMDTF